MFFFFFYVNPGSHVLINFIDDEWKLDILYKVIALRISDYGTLVWRFWVSEPVPKRMFKKVQI